MAIPRNRLSNYWQAALVFGGALIVSIATLCEAEHSPWNLVGATLAALGGLAAAFDQTRQAKKFESLLTGGDSFSFFDYPCSDIKMHRHFLCINHRGPYTINNLVASFIDVPMLLARPPGEGPVVVPSIPLGNLIPGSRSIVNEVIFAVPKFRFQITFEASNGRWSQTVLGETIEGTLAIAIQVWRLSFTDTQAINEVLYEQADSQFPRDPKGFIDWSFGTINL